MGEGEAVLALTVMASMGKFLQIPVISQAKPLLRRQTADLWSEWSARMAYVMCQTFGLRLGVHHHFFSLSMPKKPIFTNFSPPIEANYSTLPYMLYETNQ
ncbi:hypothetical protein FACS189483_05730 [Spirochaetia bacterium]|nr:hypothetical protein FACS189483_05730 [Spirochaetia bacterium]